MRDLPGHGPFLFLVGAQRKPDFIKDMAKWSEFLKDKPNILLEMYHDVNTDLILTKLAELDRLIDTGLTPLLLRDAEPCFAFACIGCDTTWIPTASVTLQRRLTLKMAERWNAAVAKSTAVRPTTERVAHDSARVKCNRVEASLQGVIPGKGASSVDCGSSLDGSVRTGGTRQISTSPRPGSFNRRTIIRTMPKARKHGQHSRHGS